MEEQNAIISLTQLGFEDHGLFSFSLVLEGDGWGQAFGQYVLSEDAHSVILIKKILKTVGVDYWEELTGKLVRVRREKPFGMILSIGHIYKDKWCDTIGSISTSGPRHLHNDDTA